jgi:hypothetical protein
MNPMFSRVHVCLVLSSLGVQAQAGKYRYREGDSGQLRGRTLLGTVANGYRNDLVLADGTATLSAGSTNDLGTWRATENGYCTIWKTIRAGQERCFTTRRFGSKVTVLNPDGSASGQFHEIK